MAHSHWYQDRFHWMIFCGGGHTHRLCWLRSPHWFLGPVHTELLAIALAMQKMFGKWHILAEDFTKEWADNPFLAMSLMVTLSLTLSMNGPLMIEPFIGAKKIAKCSNIEVPSNNLYTTHLQEVVYLRTFPLLLVLYFVMYSTVVLYYSRPMS